MNSKLRRNLIIKALVTGVLSIGLYALLLVEQDVISRIFARGGLYAFLPIAAAFLFSIVHGTFTGSFWSVLGVEAAKKK